jgi:cysteine desulfuration protein SufE
MTSIDLYLTQPHHRDLVEEYRALDSSEDRLAWLMERPPLQVPIPNELLTDDRKVPGCLSGLWLHGSTSGDMCIFAAKSESDMVQGIGSFICDLYSQRSPAEILSIGDAMVQVLGLERLLSTTRKRAVSSAVSYILHTARTHVGVEVAA